MSLKSLGLCNETDCQIALSLPVKEIENLISNLPSWETFVTATLLSVIIVLTIVGNILVILSVFTDKALRVAQNFYIVSLAVADLTVALFVLPFSLITLVLERWEFGIHVCKAWLTCDVMCCTASILNLCVIAMDRYWAVTDPINNMTKRTLTRVLGIIGGIWVLSFLISSPPLFGWNDWPREFNSTTPCKLTSDRSYVVYSAMGSFYIPLFVMAMVYFKIYIATRQRLRSRIYLSTLDRSFYKKSKLQKNIQKPSAETRKFMSLCCNRHSAESDISVFQYQEKFTKKDIVVENAQPVQDIDLTTTRPNISNKERPESDNSNGSDVPPIILPKQSCSSPEVDTPFLSNNQNKKNKTSPKCTNVQQFVAQRQRSVNLKERRASRTLAIIMGVFVICWLPFFIMYIIEPFCDACVPSNGVRNFITWLGYINSGLNPFIYTIFNMDYRKAFKRLLRFN